MTVSRSPGRGAGARGAWAQAWIEQVGEDPEAVSAFAVARARLPEARELTGLRRLRLFELHGTLPERKLLEDLLHRSTWFYNPHKERCVVRAGARDAVPLAASEQAILVYERGGERRPAAERWFRHETGQETEVREGVVYVLRYDSGADARARAAELAVLRGRERGLLCNPHAQEHALAAAGGIPLPWLGASARAAGAGERS